MSIMLVSETCINKVVAEFALQERTEWLSFGPHKLGQMLWVQNEAAFYKRYPYDKSEPGLPEFIFNPDHMPYTPVERLKACHCLYYQYSEGEVKHLVAAEALEEVIVFAEQHTTTNSPGYIEAPWCD